MNKQILGIWKLSTVRNTNERQFVNNEIISYEFKDDNKYTVKIIDDDINKEFNGDYIVYRNNNRKFLTIILIPDNKAIDTTNILYDCSFLDILSIENDKMEVIKPTDFYYNDTTSKLSYNNKIYTYIKD